MPVNMAAQRNLFDKLRGSWDALAPTFPEQANLDGTGFTVDELNRLFSEIGALFDSLSVVDIDQGFWNVKVQLIDSFMINMSAHLTDPPKPINYYTAASFFGIYQPLYSIRQLLLDLLPAAPLTRNQIRTAQQKVGEVESLLNQIKSMKSEIDGLKSATESAVVDVENAKTVADERLTSIEAISTDSVAAAAALDFSKSDIEATQIMAKASKEEIESTVAALQEAISSKEKLFKEFEDMRDSVRQLLGYANQVALANSFMKARERTKKPQIAWAITFVLALLAAGVFSFMAYQDIIKLKAPVSATEFLTKLGFLTPFLIVAYFAARQFNFLSRISADYSFKEATALAYEGYRNEVATDPELLKLLQTGAITHFGENPMHILVKTDESRSPTEESVKQLLAWFGKIAQIGKSL